MTIGSSILLIALGAILRYAVTATVVGVNIHVIGTILMVAGAVGLAVGLFMYAIATSARNGASRTETHIHQEV